MKVSSIDCNLPENRSKKTDCPESLSVLSTAKRYRLKKNLMQLENLICCLLFFFFSFFLFWMFFLLSNFFCLSLILFCYTILFLFSLILILILFKCMLCKKHKVASSIKFLFILLSSLSNISSS